MVRRVGGAASRPRCRARYAGYGRGRVRHEATEAEAEEEAEEEAAAVMVVVPVGGATPMLGPATPTAHPQRMRGGRSSGCAHHRHLWCAAATPNPHPHPNPNPNPNPNSIPSAVSNPNQVRRPSVAEQEVLSTAGRRVSGLCGFAAEPKRPAAPTTLRRAGTLGGSVRRLLPAYHPCPCASLGGRVRQLLAPSAFYGCTYYGYTYYLLLTRCANCSRPEASADPTSPTDP